MENGRICAIEYIDKCQETKWIKKNHIKKHINILVYSLQNGLPLDMVLYTCIKCVVYKIEMKWV